MGAVDDKKLLVALGLDGFPTVYLRNSNCWKAEICLRGGIVTSWKYRAKELLFCRNRISRSSQVKGGISICFPVYSILDNFENVGVAREEIWVIDQSHICPSESCVKLILKPNSLILTPWQKSYEVRLHVELELDGKLKMSAQVVNTDPRYDFKFNFAYHNFLALSHISALQIEGLSSSPYLNKPLSRDVQTEGLSIIHNPNNPQRSKIMPVEGGDILKFSESEVDKGYLNAPDKVAVVDHGKSKMFLIEKSGDILPDVVVWNPGKKITGRLYNFDKEDHENVVCIGPAALKDSIDLKPGETWTGVQQISYVDYP